MCACACVSVRAYVCAFEYVCECVCVPTFRESVFVCTCVFERVPVFFVRECEYVCACMRAFVCVSLPAYVIVYVFVFVRVCSACVCV